MQRPKDRTELCMFQGPAKKASGLESKEEDDREGESGTPTQCLPTELSWRSNRLMYIKAVQGKS